MMLNLLIFYYIGNYDTFVKTKQEREVNQMKMYEKQQEEIKHIKEFIASCGTYANLVRQVITNITFLFLFFRLKVDKRFWTK